MDTLDCIKSRRSVRKFLDKEVPDNLIKELIDCARHAPFGGPPIRECQPWEFIIVKDGKVKENLALEYEDRQFIKTAPVIIAACVNKANDIKYREWEIIVSLAIENMLLAAHSLGLGACFVSTFAHHEEHKEDRKALVEALSLPESIHLVSLIPVGYPDPSEEKKEKELREADELIHQDRW